MRLKDPYQRSRRDTLFGRLLDDDDYFSPTTFGPWVRSEWGEEGERDVLWQDFLGVHHTDQPPWINCTDEHMGVKRINERKKFKI